MNEEVARLVAVMEANLKGFTKGMDQAQKIADQRFGQIEKRMQKTESSFSGAFGKIGALIAGVVSVRALSGFILSLSETADKLDALSERTGISTDDIQKLAAVGRKANVEFGELSDGLDKFTKFVGQAAHGQGDLAKVMKDFGIKAGQDYVATLLDVANAVQNAKTRGEEYRITTAAFGRASADMVSFLRQGSVAIRDQMDAFNSGISAQAVKDLAEFNKSWKEIGVSFQNLGAGPAAAVLKGFSDFLKDLESGTWPERLQALASFLSLGLVSPPAIGDTAKQLQEITRLEKELQALELRRAGEQAPGRGPGLFSDMSKQLDAEIAAKKAELNALKNRALSHTTGINRVGPTEKPFGDGIILNDEEAKKAKKIADDLITHYVELANKITLARLDAEEKYAQERQEIIDGADQREAEALQEFIDKRQELINAADQAEAEALQEFHDKRLALIDEADQAEAERLGERQIEVADRIRGAFDITGAAGVRAFENIGDAARQLLQQLAAMAIQLAVLDPLMDALFGKKGSPLGGLVGTGLGLLGFAGGGSPPVGKASIVGEHGPELFVPTRPGQIIPNHGIGGTTVSIAVDARGAQQGVAEQLARVLPQVVQTAIVGSVRAVKQGFPSMITDYNKRQG